MASLGRSGFELNTVTNGIEFGILGAPTIVSSPVHAGGFAGKISSLISVTNQSFQLTFKSVNDNGPFYIRFYFQYTTPPSGNNDIFAIYSSTSIFVASIALTHAGALQLQTGSTTAVGSVSSVLNTSQWYRIEVLIDNTGGAGAGKLTGLIDGASWASSTALSLASGVIKFQVGGNLNGEGQTTGVWYFDDLAINDSTGANQNSYPGEGWIIHQNPNAAGDINTFATQTGGTAGSANNFTRVKETPPDDATTLNGSNTLNQEDLFAVGASGLNLSDSISYVGVGFRFRNNTADATTAIKAEIEKVTLGTITQSAAVIPNTTSWNTNETASPFSAYPINLYNDPNGNPWTQATIDSMQIGYKITTGGTNRIEVTKVWALVEYKKNPFSFIPPVNQPTLASYPTIITI